MLGSAGIIPFTPVPTRHTLVALVSASLLVYGIAHLVRRCYLQHYTRNEDGAVPTGIVYVLTSRSLPSFSSHLALHNLPTSTLSPLPHLPLSTLSSSSPLSLYSLLFLLSPPSTLSLLLISLLLLFPLFFLPLSHTICFLISSLSPSSFYHYLRCKLSM